MIERMKAFEAIPEYSDEDIQNMDTEDLGIYLELLEEREEFRHTHKMLYFQPDPWLNRLAGKMETESVCSIVASNRSGKSYTSTWLLACHLTGIYPEHYTGFKWDCAIDSWIMTPTAENFVQEGGLCKYLFGTDDDFGSGWIPLECIERVERGIGTKGLVKKAYIRHVSGGLSTIEYKSYEQGSNMLQGASIDFLVIDEEPKNPKIFPEAATRILQAPSGKGRALLSFTPTNGMTDLVAACFEGDYKAGCERITVWDCPWITPEKIEEMKRTIPQREWDLRLKGIPSLGTGAVFPQQEHEIKYYSDEVVIQPHWKVAAAIDFGYLPDPCAILFAAYDPDGGKTYIFDEFYETEKSVTEIAAWIKQRAPNIPVIYPADGNRKQVGNTHGLTLRDMFAQEGINMSQGYRVEYGNGFRREDGHNHLRKMFREGTLKVSEKCTNWYREYRVYQYDEKGKTEHCQDHAMDALRYVMQRIDSVGMRWDECQQTRFNSMYARGKRKHSRFL